jgi:hypothetical protein
MADDPEHGLRLIDEIEARGELHNYHLLPAARADLLRRLGRWAEAAAAYRHALSLVTNDAERRFLERRLAEAEAKGREDNLERSLCKGPVAERLDESLLRNVSPRPVTKTENPTQQAIAASGKSRMRRAP